MQFYYVPKEHAILYIIHPIDEDDDDSFSYLFKINPFELFREKEYDDMSFYFAVTQTCGVKLSYEMISYEEVKNLFKKKPFPELISLKDGYPYGIVLFYGMVSIILKYSSIEETELFKYGGEKNDLFISSDKFLCQIKSRDSAYLLLADEIRFDEGNMFIY
jgi:hypothetical protein